MNCSLRIFLSTIFLSSLAAMVRKMARAEGPIHSLGGTHDIPSHFAGGIGRAFNPESPAAIVPRPLAWTDRKRTFGAGKRLRTGATKDRTFHFLLAIRPARSAFFLTTMLQLPRFRGYVAVRCTSRSIQVARQSPFRQYQHRVHSIYGSCHLFFSKLSRCGRRSLR